MRILARSLFMLAAAAAGCFAQQWELGFNGGGSLVRGLPVATSTSTATAGFQSGGAFGAFLGQNLYRYIGGEIRYDYIMSDLKIKSGGTEATFTGVTHAVHYDVILHTAASDRPTQFFVAFGGGMKVFRGTGREAAYQPLSQFVYLTKTQSIKPMLSVGGGMKYRISRRAFLRTEVRDYITPFPEEVITPAPGAKITGHALHNFVPMVGLSFEF
jgi:hypothetical protein